MVQESVFERSYVIHVPDGSPLTELDSRLTRISADVTRTASAIVFRVEARLRAALVGSDGAYERRNLLGRASTLPLGIVTYSDTLTTHQLLSLSQDKCEAIELESSLSAVRRNGLRQLLDDATGYCYLTSTPAYHFITPSNRHTSVFLRVGDSLTSTDVLDQYAFWLLPSLCRAELVLVDNWSIAAIVIRTLQLLGSRAHFECFSTHPLHDRSSAEATIDRLLAHKTGAGPIACVQSVTGSGTVTDLIFSMFRTRGVVLAPDAITTIFAFANAPVSGAVLCRLPNKLEHFPSDEDCPHCQAGMPAITIDQHGYYLKAGQENDGILTRQLAEEPRPLLKGDGMESALRLHRSDPNDSRHHGFDIDVMTLLENPSFRDRLIQSARDLPNPDVVVAPNHDAGRAMGDILGAITSGPVVFANRLDQSSILSADDRERLRTARHLLIVDDVINSGSRLASYLDGLRRHFPGKETVSILVGIVRPDSDAAYRRIKNTLKSPSTSIKLAYIEKLFLPRWDEKSCPWCQEHTFLAGIANQLSDPPEWLVKRIGDLAAIRTGLRSPLLALPGTTIPTLGADSFIAAQDTSALCLSFHISSALQSLRLDVEIGKRLMPEFPVQRVFGKHHMNATIPAH